MRLREGFTLREICQEHVIVPEGLETIDFNKLISLNGSARYLWESLRGKDFRAEDVARLLTDRYDVDGEVASADADALIRAWQQVGLIAE